MLILEVTDALAVDIVESIHRGDSESSRRLLREHGELAAARLGDPGERCGMSRTLLHVATDWPGHYPNVALSITMLVDAGADVNARFTGPHAETPLHWAASSDDVQALDALLDHGADIEAPGAVIGGGTPLADAAAFGQWRAARRLVDRGARTTLWQSAALGLLDRVDAHFAGAPAASWEPGPPRADESSSDEVTHAFWCACHGGQLETVKYLAARGANLNWIGYDNLTPVDAARRSGAYEVLTWLHAQGAKSCEALSR